MDSMGLGSHRIFSEKSALVTSCGPAGVKPLFTESLVSPEDPCSGLILVEPLPQVIGYSCELPALQKPVPSSLERGGTRWPDQVSLHVITLYKHSTASLPEPHLCLLSLIRAKVFFTLQPR